MKWKFPPRWSSTLFSLFCPVGKKNNQAAQHRFFSSDLQNAVVFFFPFSRNFLTALHHCHGFLYFTVWETHPLPAWFTKYHVAYLLSHKVYQLSFHEVRKSLDRCNQVAFQKKKKKKISFLQTFSGAYWHQFKLSYKWDRGIYPTKSNHISPLSGLEYRYRKVDATWTS